MDTVFWDPVMVHLVDPLAWSECLCRCMNIIHSHLLPLLLVLQPVPVSVHEIRFRCSLSSPGQSGGLNFWLRLVYLTPAT